MILGMAPATVEGNAQQWSTAAGILGLGRAPQRSLEAEDSELSQ